MSYVDRQGAVTSGEDLSLSQYLTSRSSLVEEGIVDFLRRHYQGHILEVVGYVLQGGKRLRGILAMLLCETLGGTAIRALPAAVAVELAQAASLAHDDIIDGDRTRRGRDALHVRYDLATAVLVPHLIVPYAALSARGYGSGALGVILEGWARVTQGQVRDCLPPDSGGAGSAAGGELTNAEGEYWSIVRDKTSALFETAAVLGAMAAGVDWSDLPVREYAVWLGNAFQAADDVVDLEQYVDRPWAEMLGKQGARSMIALRGMVADHDDEAITPRAIGRARGLVSATVERCLDSVDQFPAGPARVLLRAFPAFSVERILDETSKDDPAHPCVGSVFPSGGPQCAEPSTCFPLDSGEITRTSFTLPIPPGI